VAIRRTLFASLTLRGRLLLEVAGNKVLVVNGDFSEGDARSLILEAVDYLTPAIDVRGVLCQTEGYSKRLVGQGRQRWKDKAPTPADLPDSAVEAALCVVNDNIDIRMVTRIPSLFSSRVAHGLVSYAVSRESQSYKSGANVRHFSPPNGRIADICSGPKGDSYGQGASLPRSGHELPQGNQG